MLMKNHYILLALFLLSLAANAQINLVKDLNKDKEIVSSSPGKYTGFFKAGSWLYFEAETEVGESLWKTDGTAQGTSLVKDIATVDNNNTHLEFKADYQGKLIFSADDGSHGE